MRSSVFLTAFAALAGIASAAPRLPKAASPPGDLSVLSDYFNLLASKVDASKHMAQAPQCDLSKAVQPVAPTPLPAPSEGLTLKHVAIGRGTQNYTCDLSNATAVPAAVGAVATLYNSSCIASTYPDILALLPNTTLQYNLTSQDQNTLYPSNIIVSGHHFFSNTTTPNFNMDTDSMELGFAACKKNNSVAAPAGAPIGQDNFGYGAVPWLKLLTTSGTTGNLMEIYRLNTAGGQPPATCVGQAAAFEIQYAAEYWFYEN